MLAFATGCSKSRLADNLDATWTNQPSDIELSQPLKAMDAEIYTIRVQNYYEFDEEKGDSGDVEVEAFITLDIALPQNTDSITQPLYESLAATAEIDGYFTVDSSDRITITYNPSTFKMKIDPAGRLDQINYLSQGNVVEATNVSNVYRTAIQSAVQSHVCEQMTSLTELRDIKFTDSNMQLEGQNGAQTIRLSKVVEPNK